MSVIRTPQYRSASRRVLDWCAWYTRDLTADVAADRRDEIASDLHDHAMWAEETGVPPERLRRDIFLRAVRGVPHDLSWRSGQLRAGFAEDPMPLGTRRIGSVLAALVVVGGAAVAIFGVFLLIRIARALLIADIAEAPSETLPVAVFTIIALAAVVLAVRRRTRWLGALLLAPSAAMIGVLGAQVLYFVSATSQLVISRFVSGREGVVPWWIVVVSVCVGAAVGFLGAAIWWWPEKAAAAKQATPGVTA